MMEVDVYILDVIIDYTENCNKISKMFITNNTNEEEEIFQNNFTIRSLQTRTTL